MSARRKTSSLRYGRLIVSVAVMLAAVVGLVIWTIHKRSEAREIAEALEGVRLHFPFLR